MLTDATEIEIASRARQPGIRDPNRSRKPRERFFADFAANAELAGASLLDLGPGQWDFGVIARSHGASRIVGVDNDEAVLELGRYKGFEGVAFNIKDVTRDVTTQRWSTGSPSSRETADGPGSPRGTAPRRRSPWTRSRSATG